MEIFICVVVLVLIIFIIKSNITYANSKKDEEKKTNTIIVGERVSIAPAPPVSYDVPENTQVVKIIYRYVRTTSYKGDNKWTCKICETENNSTTTYCELCGADKNSLK